MNWLGSVLKQIKACDRPEQHRNLLMIRAVDLSEICDRYVPQAPAPCVAGDEQFRVWWLWPSRARELVLSVAGDGMCVLQLLDGEHRAMIERPAFEVIKTSVQSFFDGWEHQ